MGLKPYSQERAESGQAVFSAAIAEQDEDLDDDNGMPELPEDNLPESDDVEVYVSDEPEEVEKDEPDAVERLAQLLINQNTPKVTEEEVPERAPIGDVDMAEIKKKFDAQLHEVDKPSELLDEYANALVGGALAKQNLEIQKLKREALKADPDKKYILDTYEKDVERLIAKLPAGQQSHPDAYDYAVNQVMLKNMPELKQHWIDEASPPKKTVTTRPGKTKTVRGGGQGGTPRVKQRVRATKHDEAMARAYGISVKDWLKRSGKIK